MDKNEFFHVLDELFEGKPFHEIRKALDSIEDEWLDEYRKKKLSGKAYCEDCGITYKIDECICKESTSFIKIGKIKTKNYFCPKCNKIIYQDDTQYK